MRPKLAMTVNKFYHAILQRVAISVCLLSIAFLGTLSTAHAENPRDDNAFSTSTGNQKFTRFIRQFRAIAINDGISASLYDQVTKGLTPDPLVLKRLGNQPEFNSQIWTYLEKRVNAERIATGQAKKRQLAKTIAAIELRYGVDRNIFLAIWGMESNFGSYKGDMNVVRSLATMGFLDRRKNFGRSQLLAAVKILQNGDISPEQFTGSWAGAMGPHPIYSHHL